MKRELEKLIESAWKAESTGELWQEEAIDKGFIEGQKRLAKHNLAVALSLNSLNEAVEPHEKWERCPDWVIIACYYSMHRAVLAFIGKKGWKGRGHEPTLGKLIEILQEEGKISLAEEIGEKINEARKLRVAASYSVFSPEELQPEISSLLRNAAHVLKMLEVDI